MLQDTKNAKQNMEAQLDQTRQQLSKQITEECQAVQLRSGKTLNNTVQGSKKPTKEQLTEDNQTTVQNPSEDSKSPERNVIGVQMPEREGKLALNAHSLTSFGIQTPEKGGKVGVKRPSLAQFWRSNARKGGKLGVKHPFLTQSWRSNANEGSDTFKC